MKLQEQIAGQLHDALDAENMSQAEFARSVGLTTKHVNQMVNGKSGSLAMYDYVAYVLNRKWVVVLSEAHDA